MNLLELLQSISPGNFTLIVIVLVLVCFEITPIKFNPITSIFKWLGKKMNGEVVDKVNDLSQEVQNVQQNVKNIQYDNARRSAIVYRVRILHFGDEIRQGVKHSKESYEQVLEDIDGYEKYCLAHPEFQNNKTILTKEKILETYAKCMDENDFL